MSETVTATTESEAAAAQAQTVRERKRRRRLLLKNKEEISNIQEAFDSLKEEIEKIDYELNIAATQTKSSIYREYAVIIGQFTIKNLVCGFLKKHFPKDKKIIDYALKEMPDYRDLIKGHENNPDPEIDRENRQIEQSIHHLTQENEKVRSDDSNKSIEDYGDFYNDSQIELDSELLYDLQIAMKDYPDKIVIRQQKGKAVEITRVVKG